LIEALGAGYRQGADRPVFRRSGCTHYRAQSPVARWFRGILASWFEVMLETSCLSPERSFRNPGCGNIGNSRAVPMPGELSWLDGAQRYCPFAPVSRLYRDAPPWGARTDQEWVSQSCALGGNRHSSHELLKGAGH